MSPFETDETAAQWSAQIQDAIADNSALREGLHDDAAIPLIDWGVNQADYLAARLVADETPEPDPEQVNNLAYNLTRLMTRITWVVTYREKKNPEWLARTFRKINDLSREVFGPAAVTLSDDAITEWIESHSGQDNKTLIENLIARLSPVVPSASTAPEDDGAVVQLPPSSSEEPAVPQLPQPGETTDEQTLE